jgi:hypothetical protein
VPTSKRPQIINAQYPRIPSKVLEGMLCEEIVDLEYMECRDTQISCIAARVWQSHSRHADLRKVSKHERPSTQKYLAGPSGVHPTGRPSFPRKILGVQSRLVGLTRAHRPRKVTHPGRPTRLAEP